VAQNRAELLTLARKRAALACGVQTTLSVIEGHWKLPILFRLLDGTQ
jgi:DNA-binding HxlR family transcriptional regulator